MKRKIKDLITMISQCILIASMVLGALLWLNRAYSFELSKKIEIAENRINDIDITQRKIIENMPDSRTLELQYSYICKNLDDLRQEMLQCREADKEFRVELYNILLKKK